MKYVMANSGADAVDILRRANGDGRVIAGGTDLVLDIAGGKYAPSVLVDISAAGDMREIVPREQCIAIGGSVTHSQAARSEVILREAPALAEACAAVGSLQIRNVATLAGNVVNAQPAADAAVALSALGATCVVAGEEGDRILPMERMYEGFGKSAVDSARELVREIRVPRRKKGEASAFIRLEMRKALALPMLNVAAAARVEDGVVVWARISMAPVGVGPVRAVAAEEGLVGFSLEEEVILRAAEKALEQANPRSNPLRGTRAYRMQVLPVLVARALRAVRTQLEKEEEETR